MKKKLLVSAVCFCAFLIFASAFIPASANNKPVPCAASESGVLKARFQNMLNRNFVYNDGFKDLDVIVDNSILALLDKRCEDDPEYITETVVKGFVKDMYGIDVAEISQDEGVYKEGYVYIVPRGFTSYKNTVKSITENEDGSFTVVSEVLVDPHDDNAFSAEAETLFVANENSAFGYNIIYSDLQLPASGI